MIPGGVPQFAGLESPRTPSLVASVHPLPSGTLGIPPCTQWRALWATYPSADRRIWAVKFAPLKPARYAPISLICCSPGSSATSDRWLGRMVSRWSSLRRRALRLDERHKRFGANQANFMGAAAGRKVSISGTYTITPTLFVFAEPMNGRIVVPMGPKSSDVRRSR